MKILLVTANKNETRALLESSKFSYEEERSSDSHDTNFYNIGKFGFYDVIHFELIQQGSSGSEASQLAISTAIREFSPSAVILVGIAFGKEYSDSPNPSQHIGDVLISEKVADYESGKVKGNQLLSDGAIPEGGRQLLSVFKHCERTWDYYIDQRKCKCEFGLILSGDKVVDDRKFKEDLMKAYPRAIGGEMEGRGAYAACRNRDLNEWIIVKAICDWADGTKGINKQANQEKAAHAAVSLLEHVFCDPNAFSKLENSNNVNDTTGDTISGKVESKVIGYFINFGITSCRIFKIYAEKRALRECKVVSYEISNPKNTKYLNGIIEHVKNEVLPSIDNDGNQLFIKAFADSGFADVFTNEQKRNEFIMKFYTETHLYFNIVSPKQTEENLKKLFGNIENSTAIVNIGSQYVDVLVYKGKKYTMYNLPVSISDISDYIKKHAINEEWDKDTIDNLKEYIVSKISDVLKGVKVKTAIIIKDELDFMQKNGYPLKFESGRECLSIDDYKEANRENLFEVNYKKKLEKLNLDQASLNRFYGFKNGHIILETLFELIGIEIVVPSNELSIHGSINAYIFNVAISGSTSDERAVFMIEAYNIMRDMGATVLSSKVINNQLVKKTKQSDIKHACAIRDCDLLFVCNKDGYIGTQTEHEIYGAFLLNKPIAFWKEPGESFERLEFIPHEQWWNLMRVLEESDE